MRPSSQDYNSHAGWNDALSRADDVVGIDTTLKRFMLMTELDRMILLQELVIGAMETC